MMGDMADYDIEQGMDLWFDHLHGHPVFPDECPYCEEEYEKEKKSKHESKGKQKRETS